MKSYKINKSKFELIQGDIVQQRDCQAIVNAANAQLRIGGGVAGAIHRMAGPSLEEETKPLAPIKPGEAVLTGGHNLPNEYIIHCLGPVYGRDKPEDKLLSQCYINALDLVKKHEITSVAFPAISTGAFGYPLKDAASLALETVKSELEKNGCNLLVRFVLWSEHAFSVHEKFADEMVK